MIPWGDVTDDGPMLLDECPVCVRWLLLIAVAALALYAFDHPSNWLGASLVVSTRPLDRFTRAHRALSGAIRALLNQRKPDHDSADTVDAVRLLVATRERLARPKNNDGDDDGA